MIIIVQSISFIAMTKNSHIGSFQNSDTSRHKCHSVFVTHLISRRAE